MNTKPPTQAIPPTSRTENIKAKPKLAVLNKPIWISVDEAMAATSFGRTRLYELIAAGKLQSVKIGRRRLVSFDSIATLGSQGAAP
jgi:excisionase family DNA binding protein